MDINDLQKDWNWFGKSDPLWAIITSPQKKGNKWQIAEFFDTGVGEICDLLRYIKSTSVQFSTKKALDFGCGVGRLTEALAEHFDEVHGVDVAPSMIELANNYSTHRVKVHYHLNHQPSLGMFPVDYFSFVYSNITLQHIPPAYSKEYIKEFIRILIPGGLLVFQLPSTPKKYVRASLKHAASSGLLWLFRRIRYARRPIMLMHGIKKEEVVRLLEDNGAEVIDIVENQSAGTDWVSYRYLAMKS